MINFFNFDFDGNPKDSQQRRDGKSVLDNFGKEVSTSRDTIKRIAKEDDGQKRSSESDKPC